VVIDFTFECNNILEEAEVETEVELTCLLPTEFAQGEVFRSDDLMAVVVAVCCILVVLVVASTAETGNTP